MAGLVKGGKMDAPAENSKIMRNSPLVIANAEQLDELIGLFHDEYFELDDIEYVPEQKVVRIPYRRIFHDGPRRLLLNWFILKRFEVDVVRSLITVRNVEDYTFKDSARIGTYSFNIVSYHNNYLQFDCEADLKLKMKVSGIEIESNDIEVRGKAKLTEGLIWTADSGKVYD